MRTLQAHPRPCPSSHSWVEAELPQLFPLLVTDLAACPALGHGPGAPELCHRSSLGGLKKEREDPSVQNPDVDQPCFAV